MRVGMIEVRKYQKHGANGDRATTKTPYFDYKVVLIAEGTEDELVIREFSGYDSFHSHVKPDQASVVSPYVSELEAFFHLNAEGPVVYAEKTVTTTTWERQK